MITQLVVDDSNLQQANQPKSRFRTNLSKVKRTLLCYGTTKSTSEGPVTNEDEFPKHQTDWRRFVCLINFCFLTGCSSWFWITFAPLSDDFGKYYDSSSFYINLLSTTYMFTYPIFFLPALWIMQFFNNWDKKTEKQQLPKGNGLKNTLLLASFVTSLGGWIRYFSGRSFAWTLVGQTLAGIAQTLTLGTPPALASTWFPQSERNTASALAVTCNTLGTAIGFLTTPYMVSSDQLESTVPFYLRFQAIISTIIMITILFSFPYRPKYSPSDSNSESTNTSPKSNILQSIAKLMIQPEFRWLSLSYGIVVGGQYAVTTLLAAFLSPLFPTHSQTETGQLGFISMCVGMGSSILGGVYLDRTGRYKSFSNQLYTLTVISLCTWIVFLELKWWIGAYILCILYVTITACVIPVVFQFASVKHYTYTETTLTGILNSGAQIFGLVFITVLSWSESWFPIANDPNGNGIFTFRYQLWVLFIIHLIGRVMVYFS